MGIFYLIDQSLKGLGGHHFDYTRLLTEAVKKAGGTVAVGCHRRFKSSDSLPDCDVRNVFRNTTYASCSSLVGIQDMVARRRPGLFGSIKNWFSSKRSVSQSPADSSWQSSEQQNRVRAFKEDCDQFFSRPLTREDIVFLTTLSDLEADGLYQFIRSRPDAKLANWHLQFHFPIFRGRTPDYENQLGQSEYLVRTLRKLNTLAQTNIHFYVTSDNLRDQYERTGFEFEELPYPINPELRGTGTLSQPQLFRLAFAGAIRDEKGGDQVPRLIDQFDSQIQSRIRLCVQKKRPKFLKRIRQWFVKESMPEQVVNIPYPLSATDYLDHIKNSDIGLLTTYDSETYFPRRAGILGEYLAAGVPVIVPAGSWLSDQVEKCQRSYLRNLDSTFAPSTIQPKTVSNQSTGKTVAVFDTNRIVQECHQQKFVTGVVAFDVEKPNGHGNYFRVKLLPASRQVEAQSSIAAHAEQVVGFERDSQNSSNQILVAFDLSKTDGEKLQIEISSAYGSAEWQIENIRLRIFSSEQVIPRSTVGLVASNASQTSNLSKEMIEQYGHYKKSAVDFSESWFEKHDPCLTFQTLINNSALSISEKGQAA